MSNFSQTIDKRLIRASTVTGETALGPQMVDLADVRPFWATLTCTDEWSGLQPGHQLLLVRTKNQHLRYPLCIEMATIGYSDPHIVGGPHLALAWGWRTHDQVDDRPGAILYHPELATILRYEVGDTGCTDVVTTILYTAN